MVPQVHTRICTTERP